MKTKNELRLGASLVSDDGGALELVNLRPAVDSNGSMVLRPALAPTSETLPQGWSALVKIGGKLVIAKGTSVAVYDSGTTVLASEELPGAALCCQTLSGKALVMCDGGAAYVTVSDGVPTVTAATTDYPAIGIMGVDDMSLSVTVDSRTLSRAYSSGMFDKKDRDALLGDLSDAYRRLCADAVSNGVMIQPALMRYRLLDGSGMTVFESAPVLVGHSGGAQCTDTVGLTSPDRTTVNSYALTASAWRCEVALPSAPGTDVAQAEIMMTPLFHPYDPSLPGTATLNRATSSASRFASVGLPGRERGLGTVYKDNGARILMSAIARIEQLEERVAVITDPFGGGARKVGIDIAAEPDPAADTSRIKKILARPVNARDYTSTMLGAPHGFIARCCAESSGAVAWGNIETLRYRGYPLGMFSAKNEPGSWRGTTAVYFGGGKGVMRGESGDGDAPSILGPVLCYPAPDARELTAVVYHNGVNHKQTFSLTPDASGRYSVYISPGLKPFALPQCPQTESASVDEERISHCERVAFAAVDRPLDIRASRACDSEVIAIAGRDSSEQAWDFGRSRFTVGCRQSVYSAGVNLSTGSTGMRTLCRPGIDRADALAVGVDGEVYVAVDGLLQLPGGGKGRRLSYDGSIVALGYDKRRDELWALHSDGATDIYCRRHGMGRFRLGGVSFDSFADIGGLHLVGGRRLYDVGGEQHGPRDIVLRLRGCPGARYGLTTPRRMYLAAQATEVDGVVSVRGHGVGDIRRWTLRSGRVKGTVAGPIAIALPGRPVQAVEAAIEANVSEDFVFDSFTLSHD